MIAAQREYLDGLNRASFFASDGRPETDETDSGRRFDD
jgi:hypothetical protein